jgi:hypothetical protein
MPRQSQMALPASFAEGSKVPVWLVADTWFSPGSEAGGLPR